jgi:hypothetical protein
MVHKKEGAVTQLGDDGREYSGYYHFDNDLLTVSCKFGTEKTYLARGADPEPLARILLANIIKNAPKK